MKDKVKTTYFESKLDIKSNKTYKSSILKKNKKHNKQHSKNTKKIYKKTHKFNNNIDLNKQNNIDLNKQNNIDNIHIIKDVIFRNFILDCKEFESYCVYFYVNVGSSNEEKGYYGISHVLEHMIFKKTSYFKNAIALASYLEEFNITFNAYTNFNKTCYMYTTNNNKSDNLKRIFFVAYQMLFELEINNKDMDIEKNIILQEYYQEQDNKTEVIDSIFDIIYYGNHPYFIPTIGYIDNIKKVNSSNIIQFYKKYYIPKNINCFIFGNCPSIKFCINYFNDYFMKNILKHFISKIHTKTNSRNHKQHFNKYILPIKIITNFTNNTDEIKKHIQILKNISHKFDRYNLEDAYNTLKQLTNNNSNLLNKIIASNIQQYLNSNSFHIIYKKNNKSHNNPNYLITTKLQDMKQAYIYLIIPNNGLNDINKHNITLFTNIIGNRKLFTNVLFNIFREKYGVSYNINVDNNLLMNCGYSYIILKVNHNDLNKTIKILNSVISQLLKDCKNDLETKNNLITKDKFNNIKNFLINDINTLYNSISNIESLYVDKIIYQYELFNLDTYKSEIINIKYIDFKKIIHLYLQKYLLYIFK